MPVLGHGIDLVDIARIERTLDDHAERFVERCFTRAEQRYCENGPAVRAQRFAGRFAAKEAVLKALGTGLTDGLAWTQIEILADDAGAPQVSLSAGAFDRSSRIGITRWWLSISHTGTHAIASAVAWGPSTPRDHVET